MEKNPENTYRFDGLRRLYGAEKIRRLRSAHVLVVGLGGVGSWVAEGLARSAVGALTLVDYDDVCISNTNRQIQALQSNTGQPKVAVLQKRIFEINPECRVRPVQDFFSEDSQDSLFGADRSARRYTGVVDCIDKTLNKKQLAWVCHQTSTPLVVVGSAGGRQDPSQVRVADLSQTVEDSMLSNLRKDLRRQHGFPRGKNKFSIPAVFSMEKATYLGEDGCPTFQKPEGHRGALDCQSSLGSSMAVTVTFAMHAVAQTIDRL